MTDDRIDFASLFDGTGNSQVDDLVRRVNVQCAPGLAMRRSRRTTFQIVAWRRPALAAALVIAAVSTVVLARSRRVETPPSRIAATTTVPAVRMQLAAALGVPTVISGRLTSNTPPTIDELLPEIGR